MAQLPLTEQSIEQLTKQKRVFTGILVAFFIVWLVLIGSIIYIFVNKKPNYALLVVAFALWPTMLPAIVNLGKVNKEIKARTQKN
ncbi:hypothetical protein JMG10_11835 [Nostoc ellipsosporum NOK]|nr:hypothetical protein [Nostoc ellipsosporum NOK]